MNSLLYYKTTIVWPEPSGTFIVGIDISDNKILFFTEDNLTLPLAHVDLNNPEARIPQILMFHARASIRAFLCALRCIQNNTFPARMSHQNCAESILMEKI